MNDMFLLGKVSDKIGNLHLFYSLDLKTSRCGLVTFSYRSTSQILQFYNLTITLSVSIMSHKRLE